MKRLLLLGLFFCFIAALSAQQSNSYTGAVMNEVKVVKYIDKEISILTNVSAERIINNESLGVADFAIYKLRCGKYHVKLQAEGYQPLEKDIMVLPDGPAEFVFELLPTHKDITIITDIPAERIINNESLGEAEVATYKLSFGKCHISLKAEGYLPLEKDIIVKLDGPTEYTFKLVSSQKEITVVTNIPTERILDNQHMDFSGNDTYTVTCGNHNLTLKADGYYTQKHSLRIAPSSASKYKYTMYKKPKLPTQWQQFVMLDYTWGENSSSSTTSTHSLGLRYGWQKIVGWYVAMNVSLQGAHYAQTKDYCLTETDRISRNKISVLGGVNIWLGCPLYFYTGLGYGYQNLLEVSKDGEYTRPYQSYYWYPHHGVAWEFGLQGGYKGVTLRFGYALVGSSEEVFNELSIGLGYTFNK